MFYKPEKGGIWDPSIIFYKGYYYMCSMYFKDGETPRNDYMWCARSEDGVHWEDVGSVLEDRAGVCKMFLYETPEGVVADFGSFGDPQKVNNDTLRYYRSKDMIHWDYLGQNHPDGQWYHRAGRWDHMYVIYENGTYYGYPVATPLPEYQSAWGLCKSTDGVNWTVCPPPVIEWGSVPPINCLEGGGVEKIGDKYYYIGGFVGYAGNYGYGLYTFTADSPEGPFRPSRGAFRLCGFDRLPGRVFIQNLAAFVRGKNGELLISNAVDTGGSHEIWLLPLRKAILDENGGLHQGYWEGNDAVKGTPIPLGDDAFRVVSCRFFEGSPLPAPDYLCSRFQWSEGVLTANTDNCPGPSVTDHNMLILLDRDLDLSRGCVLEGKVSAASYPPYDEVNHCTVNWRPASFGFFFEEQGGGGMDVALEIGHPYKRFTFTENVALGPDNELRREVVDTIGEDCANVRGMSALDEHRFTVLIRRNVFEVYLDGLHVQTFVHLRPQTNRIGFTLQNSRVRIWDLKVYPMNLDGRME